jgi:hypothetical protein
MASAERENHEEFALSVANSRHCGH